MGVVLFWDEMLLFTFLQRPCLSSNLSRSFSFTNFLKIFQISYSVQQLWSLFYLCVNDFICKSYTVFIFTLGLDSYFSFICFIRL